MSILSLLGDETSAYEVAKSLAAGTPMVDVVATLNAKRIDNFTWNHTCEAEAFQLMALENAAATKESRTALSYVDLTSKALCPHWLPHDAIGGRLLNRPVEVDDGPRARVDSRHRVLVRRAVRADEN